MVFSYNDIFGKLDGVDFINVFSRGKTKLGQLLSNFAHTPFKYKGKQFESVEGYWFYKVSGGDPKFYLVYGSEAKQRGKEIVNRQPGPTREELKEVYKAKLESNLHFTKLLRESSLPLAHYYQYNGPPMSADNYLWTVEIWDEIRNELKIMNKLKEIIDYSWYKPLSPFFKSDAFKIIMKKLKELKDKGRIIRPSFEKTFVNLNNCPLPNVKVVLVIQAGLTPSENDKVADALCDAITKSFPKNDDNVWKNKVPKILLVPTNITACDGENHRSLWEPYTREVFKVLQSKKDLIYCLVGKQAQDFRAEIDEDNNQVYCIEHPLQAIANKREWKYNNVFSKINKSIK